MFGTVDLPHGVSLRPSRSGDRAFERMVHDASRWDLWLADADPDEIRDIVAMQHTAQSEGYGHQFPDALYFIIEKTGTACGRLVLDFSGNTVHVVDIALIPEAQGKGIGPCVLQAVQNIAGQIGAPVVLMTQTMNTPALRLYKKLGFQLLDRPNPAYVRLSWTMPKAI